MISNSSHICFSLSMEGLRLQATRTVQSTYSIMILEGFCIRSLVRLQTQFPSEMADFNLGLIKPVRAVKFSPAGKLLAGAGDSQTIALFDAASGEQVANLTGHGAWIFSLDWSFTGEYLLSG
jgi:WD40 repeat protein